MKCNGQREQYRFQDFLLDKKHKGSNLVENAENQIWQKPQRIRFGKKHRESDLAENAENEIWQKTQRIRFGRKRRKKDILTSCKRPKWPIRPNKRLHLKCCLVFENNKSK